MSINRAKKNVQDLLEGLPPNYPVDGIYLNGIFVPVFNFSNVCDCIAYFTDDEGQIIAVNINKVDGITFGEGD